MLKLGRLEKKDLQAGKHMDRAQRLGKNIRCIRVAYGESQEKLGEAIGVEKNTVSYYENGKREPNKDILRAIAVHYMVSVEELLTGDFSSLEKIRTVSRKELRDLAKPSRRRQSLAESNLSASFWVFATSLMLVKELSWHS